mgnify:FL=1
MRKLGQFEVNAVGLGCMNLSHAYGVPPTREQGEAVLQKALDLGIDHFDTAALYGFGRTEQLVGPFLKPYRDRLVLFSKCGLRGEDGKRSIDGRTEKLREYLENSLRRLQTDVIDLYYLHRYDIGTPVPIEDSVGALSEFVKEGKVREIGLSEVSGETLQRAHTVHPVAAVQSEYSLWSREVEISVLDTCAVLGVAFVAFSPLARGFLTSVDVVPGEFAEKDIRRGMPRFNVPYLSKNRPVLEPFRRLSATAGCTPAHLSLAWVLSRGEHIHAIPGTTSPTHLEENVRALGVKLDQSVIDQADALINNTTISGTRYPPATQAEIDTEAFA